MDSILFILTIIGIGGIGIAFLLFKQLEKERRTREEIENNLQKEFENTKRIRDDAQKAKNQLDISNNFIQESQEEIKKLKILLDESGLTEKSGKLLLEISKSETKILKLKDIYKRLKYAVDNQNLTAISESEISEVLLPTIELPFRSMGMKELRRKMSENKQELKKVIAAYESRYTTKSNISIYRLMVIALESELQNVLYTLKYEKLTNAENAIREICIKYFSICSDGNQSIAPTIKKFISEAEYLFLNMVKIEYEYYTQQAAQREKLREQAAERKILAEQAARLKKEEEKYKQEIEKTKEQILTETDPIKLEELKKRDNELSELYNEIENKREEIVKRQNGLAGYIYVISNRGSFGENAFKIGMTRRDNWAERIAELNNASVPFPFDIHATMFVENAAGLENEIHKELNEKRLNRVNRRKEFFSVSVDELENLIYKLQPTVEFNRNMPATQYEESLNYGEPISNYIFDEDYDEIEMEEEF